MMDKTITKTLTAGRDDAKYLHILEISGHRLKVDIRSNSYDFQCHARVSRWNDSKWELVHSIPYGAMKTPSGLVYGRNPATDADYTADLTELLRVATAILGVQTTTRSW